MAPTFWSRQSLNAVSSLDEHHLAHLRRPGGRLGEAGDVSLRVVTEKCRAGRLTHPELRRFQGLAKTGRAWAPLYGMELRELLPFTVWTAIRLAVAAV